MISEKRTFLSLKVNFIFLIGLALVVTGAILILRDSGSDYIIGNGVYWFGGFVMGMSLIEMQYRKVGQ